jgi:hypothetical protein
MSKTFHHRLRVRYGECDPQGVVFNANYLNYYDVAMAEFHREVIGPYAELVDEGLEMVVARHRCGSWARPASMTSSTSPSGSRESGRPPNQRTRSEVTNRDVDAKQKTGGGACVISLGRSTGLGASFVAHRRSAEASISAIGRR